MSESANTESQVDSLVARIEGLLEQEDFATAYAECQQLAGLAPRLDALHVLTARSMMPGENYMRLLRRLHEHLQPASYVEIGVAAGKSLAAAAESTRAIGIDPCPRIKPEIRSRARLYPTESDKFFQRYNLFEELGVDSLDLAFIDGLHIFEQAFRDFINLEKYAGPQTVIAIHDCYPPTELSAERDRESRYWLGDVWRLVPALRKYRPDLTVVVVPALPSGIAVVTGLDGSSTTLSDHYDDIVEEFLAVNYADMDAQREEFLNPIANDWDAVRALLPAK